MLQVLEDYGGKSRLLYPAKPLAIEEEGINSLYDINKLKEFMSTTSAFLRLLGAINGMREEWAQPREKEGK